MHFKIQDIVLGMQFFFSYMYVFFFCTFSLLKITSWYMILCTRTHVQTSGLCAILVLTTQTTYMYPWLFLRSLGNCSKCVHPSYISCVCYKVLGYASRIHGPWNELGTSSYIPLYNWRILHPGILGFRPGYSSIVLSGLTQVSYCTCFILLIMVILLYRYLHLGWWILHQFCNSLGQDVL